MKLLCELCNYGQFYNKLTYHHMAFVGWELSAKENEGWGSQTESPVLGVGIVHNCPLPPLPMPLLCTQVRVLRLLIPVQPSFPYLTRQRHLRTKRKPKLLQWYDDTMQGYRQLLAYFTFAHGHAEFSQRLAGELSWQPHPPLPMPTISCTPATC